MGNSTVIIGLGYKARRGKDTVANAIIEARGSQYDIRRYAFADALREEVFNAAIDRWIQDRGALDPTAPTPLGVMENLCNWAGVPFDPNAQVEPNYPLTKQRALYQWWGTEYRRSKDAFYWVNKLRERIEREKPQFAIVTDVRFRNELSYIRSFEGFTVLVGREGYEDQMTSAQQGHASEVELDAADPSVWTHTVIGKEGDVEGLKAQGIALFDGIVESFAFPELDRILAQYSNAA